MLLGVIFGGLLGPATRCYYSGHLLGDDELGPLHVYIYVGSYPLCCEIEKSNGIIKLRTHMLLFFCDFNRKESQRPHLRSAARPVSVCMSRVPAWFGTGGWGGVEFVEG